MSGQNSFDLEKSIQYHRNASIVKDIVGEWTLVKSHNTQQFLRKRNAGVFLDIVFLSSNHSFEMEGRVMTQRQTIGDEVIMEYTSDLGKLSALPNCDIQDTVEDDGKLLRTTHITFVKNPSGFVGYIYDVEDRFIKDGCLHIVNNINKTSDSQSWDAVRCTRIYKKIDMDARLGNSIQTDILGEWEPVAVDGEYPNTMKDHEKMLCETGNVSITMMTIFNEIYINHSDGNVTKKSVAALGEDGNGSSTFFKNNTLVTVEIGQAAKKTVRFVKNGKLFVSYSENGSNFMIVYQKM